MKPGFPVTILPRLRRFAQLILDTVVILNSMSLIKEANSGPFVALTLCTSIDLFDMIWYSNLMEGWDLTQNQNERFSLNILTIRRHKAKETYTANKPINSIQLAMEKAPPSSVLRLVTTFWSSYKEQKMAPNKAFFIHKLNNNMPIVLSSSDE